MCGLCAHSAKLPRTHDSSEDEQRGENHCGTRARTLSWDLAKTHPTWPQSDFEQVGREFESLRVRLDSISWQAAGGRPAGLCACGVPTFPLSRSSALASEWRALMPGQILQRGKATASSRSSWRITSTSRGLGAADTKLPTISSSRSDPGSAHCATNATCLAAECWRARGCQTPLDWGRAGPENPRAQTDGGAPHD